MITSESIVASGFSRTSPVLKSFLVLCAIQAGLFAIVPAASAQDTHLLVIAGVGGDEDHVKQFNKYALAIVDAAKKHGVAEANIAYLGENPEPSGGRMKARATRENLPTWPPQPRRSTTSSSCSSDTAASTAVKARSTSPDLT
jgi:hypothetical protein